MVKLQNSANVYSYLLSSMKLENVKVQTAQLILQK